MARCEKGKPACSDFMIYFNLGFRLNSEPPATGHNRHICEANNLMRGTSNEKPEISHALGFLLITVLT